MSNRYQIVFFLAIAMWLAVTPPALATSLPRPLTRPAAPQFAVPVTAVLPADGSRTVRPDTPLQLTLDPSARTFRRLRRALERGRFQVLLNGQPLVAHYDANLHRVTASHPPLTRYSDYLLQLVVKPRPSGLSAVFSSRFQTGSDLAEPTQVRLLAMSPQAVAGESAWVSLAVADDYGNPASGNLATRAEESGPRLDASARRPTGSVTGQTQLILSDREAESVVYRFHLSGPYQDGRDDHDLSAVITFLPGPVAKADLHLAGPLIVGRPTAVQARLQDQYDNPVPGAEVRFASTNAGVRFQPAQATTDALGLATTSITPAPGLVDIRLSGKGFSLGPEQTGLPPVTLASPTRCTNVHGVVGGGTPEMSYTLAMGVGRVTVQQDDIVSTAAWRLTGPGGFAGAGWEDQSAGWIGANPVYTFDLSAPGTYVLTFSSYWSYAPYNVKLCYPGP